MRRPLVILLLLAVAWLAVPSRADIVRTKHNLSVTGPGPLKAYGERRICVFCHTPHSARRQTPLWNRRDSGRVYVKYWSPTLDAYGPGAAPPLDGASRLCMSCHDGTVALGEVLQGGPIRMRPGADRIPTRPGRFSGTDLTGSHPISFEVTDDLIARNNTRDMPLKPLNVIRADTDVRLDGNNKLQCTTCHDPHKNRYEASSGVPFYRKPTWEGVCLVCHEQ